LCNDLETVAVLKCPDVLTAKEALIKYGAIGALMSGSGPTVFGLFSDSDKAREASQSLCQENNNWQLYLAEMIIRDTDSGLMIQN
jgi:4-diphosphocytidyl-2-C-methyl-D-erythritol kinase